MSNRTLTEIEYETIVRETCESPFGPDVIIVDEPNLTERDYLYAVWYKLAKYFGCEIPMQPTHNNRSEIEVLRDEIHRLVTEHQSTNYDVQPTLYKHIRAALEKSERES